MNEPAPPQQAAQRRDVAFGEVDDVEVVAHAGAVGRVVVVAEDAQLRRAGRPPPAATYGIRLLGVPRGSSPIVPLGCAPTGLK